MAFVRASASRRVIAEAFGGLPVSLVNTDEDTPIDNSFVAIFATQGCQRWARGKRNGRTGSRRSISSVRESSMVFTSKASVAAQCLATVMTQEFPLACAVAFALGVADRSARIPTLHGPSHDLKDRLKKLP